MTLALATSVFRRIGRTGFCFLMGALITGCGTLKNGRGWGEDAIYPINWKRIPQAAKNAALDPLTYVPLAGAAVIAVGDFDHRVSDWAVENTPVFGSVDTAKDYSDIAKNVLSGEAFGTALLTPSGPEPGNWLWSKTRGIVVEGGAILLTESATSGLKSASGRERPDGSSHNSMPSGHSSAAFAGMSLANRNLDFIEMNQQARTGIKAANVALATSVAWARVEGEKHFPTDVLVGAALGNFLTRFIHDAFIGLDRDDRFSFYLEAGPDGGKAFLAWDF